MRQLDPVTNLILAALAGAGLLGTMSMPWFVPPASSPKDTDGPIEEAAWKVGHFFGTDVDGSIKGSDAVGNKSVLYVAVLAIVVCAGLVAVPQVRKTAEDILRVAAFVPPLAVIYLAATHNGTSGEVQAHYGILAAIAVACFVTSCAWHGANLRARRKQAPRAIRVSQS